MDTLKKALVNINREFLLSRQDVVSAESLLAANEENNRMLAALATEDSCKLKDV